MNGECVFLFSTEESLGLHLDNTGLSVLKGHGIHLNIIYVIFVILILHISLRSWCKKKDKKQSRAKFLSLESYGHITDNPIWCESSRATDSSKQYQETETPQKNTELL